MPRFVTNDPLSFRGQARLDTEVIAAKILSAVRQGIIEQLGDRLRRLGGELVVSRTTTGVLISVRIPEGTDDTKGRAIEQEFETYVKKLGAIRTGTTMPTEPADGLKTLLVSKGVL